MGREKPAQGETGRDRLNEVGAKLPSPNNRGLVLKEGNIIRKTYTSRRGSGQELNEFEVFFPSLIRCPFILCWF